MCVCCIEGYGGVSPAKQFTFVGSQHCRAVGLKHRCAERNSWYSTSGDCGSDDATEQSEKQLH